ncbi:MAG TPA: HEAT repeat domain-containing protein [Planctomycetota bacterium]|nr:HEAT repeat domain-containing protein [Planctomycetota bacterium]
MLYAGLLMLPLLLQGPGGGKVKDIEFDLLILKNGNRITGTVIGSNDTEILIRVKGALLGVRKEHVEKQTKVILRVKEAAPILAPIGPGGGPSEGPKGPTGSKPIRHNLKLPDPDQVLARKINAVLDRIAVEGEEQRDRSIQELAATGVHGQVYLVQGLLERPQLFSPILKAIEAMPETDGLHYLMLALPYLPPQVRVDSINILGSKQYHGSIGAVSEELASEDMAVRAASVMALANLKAEAKFGAILDQFDSKHHYLLSMVSQAVEKMLAETSFAEIGRSQLLERMRSSSEVVRANVAAICGRLKIKESLPSLIELLSDASEDVRAASCFALGELRDAEAIEHLKTRYWAETSSFVKVKLIDALKSIQDRSVCPFLVDLLDDSDEKVRDAALKGLQHITRQDFKFDRDRWQQYLQSQKPR